MLDQRYLILAVKAALELSFMRFWKRGRKILKRGLLTRTCATLDH
jgi:hypothetical protein